MLPKLLLIASSALLAVSAQTQSKWNFAGYPAPGSKPVPKPEWMDLLKTANIAAIKPVPLKNGGMFDVFIYLYYFNKNIVNILFIL